MRTLQLILFAIIAFNALQAEGNASVVIELKDAYFDDKLEVTIRGMDGTEEGFKDKDIRIGVRNLKGYPVTIKVAPGFILNSEEGDVQDMIVTEAMEWIVDNEQYNEAGLHAMCIQAGNMSPGGGDTFTPDKYDGGNLGALAEFVYKNNFQNYMGQEAMWVLSDNHSIYDINSNGGKATPLMQFVSGLTRTPFDPSLINDQTRYVERTVKEYALFLKFYLDGREDIKLQVFNQKGEFERDLMVKHNQEPGRYDIQYKISLIGLLGEKYYVRLYVGEEMRNEFTLVIKES